ncbi:MAG: hypothetical protein Q7V58_09305 [Actinomycetota bacterium]|nr:hypothetical protein [Actinomycetota bacterium]
MRSLAPRLPRVVRRHRRSVAGVLAGLGVLLAVGAMRAEPAPPPTPPATTAGADLRAGEVAVPALLSSAAVAALLSVGDVVDVIGGTPVASVLARNARVLGIPGSPVGAAATAVVVLAVRESEALPVGQAVGDGTVMVIIRSRAARR